MRVREYTVVAALLACSTAATAQAPTAGMKRMQLPTAPRAQRPAGELTPTPGIGGPAAELEAMHEQARRATDAGLALFADKEQRAAGKVALEEAYTQWRGTAKRAQALAQQQAEAATAREQEIESKRAAIAKAETPEAKRAAVDEAGATQQAAMKLRLAADSAEASVGRQVAALKDFSAGIKDEDALKVRNAAGVLSMEVRRAAAALAALQ